MSGGEELRALSADLRDAPRKTEREVRQVIRKGGVQIKERMQSEMLRSRSFGHIARSIDFDEVGGSGLIGVEVGPNAAGPGGRSAPLAGIAYFGSSRPGGATVPDPRGALEAEAQEAQRWIQRIAGDVL